MNVSKRKFIKLANQVRKIVEKEEKDSKRKL